jgi:hypothetical protein
VKEVFEFSDKSINHVFRPFSNTLLFKIHHSAFAADRYCGFNHGPGQQGTFQQEARQAEPFSFHMRSHAAFAGNYSLSGG